MQYGTVPPSRSVVGHRWSWWDRKRYRSNCMYQNDKGWDSNDQVYLDDIITQLAEAESPTTESPVYNTDEIINLMPSHQALISDVGFTLTRKRLCSKGHSYDTYRTISQYGGGPSSSGSSSIRGRKAPRSKSAKHVVVNLTSDERVFPVLTTDSQCSLNRTSDEVEMDTFQNPQFFVPLYEEFEEITSPPNELLSQKSVSKRGETIRRMPSSMPIKRKFRAQFYRRQVSQLPSLVQLTYYFLKDIKRISTDVDEYFKHFGLWSKELKTIEGKYGTNVLAYFTFVRLLFLLNLFTAVLFIFFVIIPGSVRNFDSCLSDKSSFFVKINSTENVTNSHHSADCYEVYCSDVEKENFFQSVADFLKGTGWMSDKLLFIGTYQSYVKGSDGRRTYNLNLAYVLITLLFLLVSLILMVLSYLSFLSTGRGIKYAIVTPDDRYQKYFAKLFAGWDYCIRNPNIAYLKRKILRRDIINELAYQNDQQRRQNRNQEELWNLYTRRILILLLNFVLIIGSFVIIYIVTNSALLYASKDRRKALSPFVSLIFEYLPSMTITLLNFVVPLAFNFFTPFEDYSPGIEVRLALIKTVFLRLASVIVLVLTVILQTMQCDEIITEFDDDGKAFFGSQQIFVDGAIVKVTSWSICGERPQCKCWETYMGQQLYKLTILDFFVTILMTFCVDLPRKIVVNRWSNRVTRFIGKQKFELPSNVLDIVYVQTLCWLGCFYCPFLPLIISAKILVVFYLKWFALEKIYDLSFKPYKTTKTHAFFVSILMISFFVSISTFGFVVSNIKPSTFCGPFRSLSTIWLVFIELVEEFPRNLRRFVFMFGNPPFNLLVFFILILSGFYYQAAAVANKNLVRHLKYCLINEGRDRLFLVENINKRANGNAQQRAQ